MENVRSIHDLLNTGEVAKPERMLTVTDKESLAEEGTNLTVTSIAIGDDKQFGPFWEVKANVADEPVTFRLSQHKRRDAFMTSLASALAQGPISGLRLTSYPGQGGNSFIQLEPI